MNTSFSSIFQVIYQSPISNTILELSSPLSAFNDAFAFFLNGENIALLPDGETEVTINNVNHFVNTEYFVGNDISEEAGIQYPKIEADGFTTALVAKGVPRSVDDGNDVRYFLLGHSLFLLANFLMH